MYYLIYITEKCNLFCKYCDSGGRRILHGRDISDSLDDVVAFLARDDNVRIKLYGGEPMLAPELIHQLLRRVKPKSAVLQTNGTLLEAITPELFDLIDAVSVSFDGPAEITDLKRGRGVFDHVMEQTRGLLERGYPGRLDARMTISPGVEIERAVGYFFDGCELPFERIHWQLNACFNASQWSFRSADIRDWFEHSYNPQISALIARWVDELVSHDRYLQLVPFACLVHDLITGDRRETVRCGSGEEMWTITPAGEIYPCPIMREYPEDSVGNVRTITPGQLAPSHALGEPCTSCDLLGMCGGRCLCANLYREWGTQGQAVVCGSVRHLVGQLEEVAPIIETLIATDRLTLDQLLIGEDYEEIP